MAAAAAAAAAVGALLSFGLVLEVAGLVEMTPMCIIYWCYLQQAANKEMMTASMIGKQIPIQNLIQSIYIYIL